MRVAIADDERPAREELRHLLGEIPEVEVVGEASTGAETLALVERERPELLLLDLQMPGMSGLEVAERLRGRPDAPWVVFVTAYDEHALAAFEREAVDYVLKPPNPARFRRSMARVQGLLRNAGRKLEAEAHAAAQPPSATAPAGPAPPASFRLLGRRPQERSQVVLRPDEVQYVEARGDACFAHRGDEELAVRGTLQELANDLAAHGFYRIHRSYVANLDHIEELVPWFSGTYRAKLKGAPSGGLPVSRSAMKALRGRLRSGGKADGPA
ncbi:MAG: response regulator transcription factor [Planctomycetes bacterium]|nr:response regulator transcription factor [Planctomycetota bacterium]